MVYGNSKLIILAVVITLLLMISTGLSGQSTASIEDYIRDNEALPGEKVYIHTDRSDYMQGDTIWFKAYSWFGYDQTPDTLSGVLYVDLLNSEGKVRLSRKLLIYNGTSHGDFCLDASVRPGVYTIRAYTRWMGNVNTGEPYYKAINVSPSGQNFQVECTPTIMRWTGNDSLIVRLNFFEIDNSGGLSYSHNHNVKYSLKIGSLVLDSGQFLASNIKGQIFRRNLPAISEADAVLTLSIKDPAVNFEKQIRIPVKDAIDLQFFPEGGRLVYGLSSRVAFKAVGTDGLSREVQGTIEDSDGAVIAIFKSSHKGMGSFLLKPVEGKEYSANLWYNNRKYVIPMPNASRAGSVMTINSLQNEKARVLTLKQSNPEVNTQKYIIGSAYGKNWFSVMVNMTKDSCSFKIPQQLLPEGICRLTVLDRNFKPECERLIYIDKNQRFNIEVTPDSLSYATRSKVTLQIKTTGADGLPVQTELSLAVIDMEQEAKGKEENGIVAYKLLDSELKGFIEDAGYYFEDDSCTDYESLDLLMMTQGYREFLPDTTKGNVIFQPEREFAVSGNLKLNGSKSRAKRYNYNNLELALLCFSETPYIKQFNPDSAGTFRIKLPLLYGKARSILQASAPNKKTFYGEVSLDDPFPKPEFKVPLVSNNTIESPVIEYVKRLQATKKTEVTKVPGYGVMSATLPEVTVTAKAKNWHTDFEPNAEKVANLDSLDPDGNRYTDIFDLLVKEFGAHWITWKGLRTISLPSYSTFGKSITEFFPIYVVNGQIYWNGEHWGERGYEDLVSGPLETLQAFHINEIKKVMVLPPGGALSIYYASLLFRKAGFYQSLVAIETYSTNTYRGDPTGTKTFILDGLDSPRQFYSPRYDVPHQSNKMYDGRATLFWNPSIRTDASGKAQVVFFTSDRETGLKLTVNGIESGNGNPGHEHILISPQK